MSTRSDSHAAIAVTLLVLGAVVLALFQIGDARDDAPATTAPPSTSFAAVTTSTAPPRTVTVPVPVAPPTSAPVQAASDLSYETRVEVYLSLVRGEWPLQTLGVDDDALVEVAEGWCRLAGMAETPEAWQATFVDVVLGADPPGPEWVEFAAYQAGSAVAAFCPEHQWLIEGMG